MLALYNMSFFFLAGPKLPAQAGREADAQKMELVEDLRESCETPQRGNCQGLGLAFRPGIGTGFRAESGSAPT